MSLLFIEEMVLNEQQCNLSCNEVLEKQDIENANVNRQEIGGKLFQDRLKLTL